MKKIQKDNFEEKIKLLEEIVQKLEDGETSLDESLQLFEKGILLSSECYEYLNNADKKIKQLIKSQNGKFELTEFE